MDKKTIDSLYARQMEIVLLEQQLTECLREQEKIMVNSGDLPLAILSKMVHDIADHYAELNVGNARLLDTFGDIKKKFDELE